MDIPSLIIIAYFFLTLLVSFLCRRRNTELQRLLVAPQQLGLVLTVPLIFSGLFGGSTITALWLRPLQEASAPHGIFSAPPLDACCSSCWSSGFTGQWPW